MNKENKHIDLESLKRETPFKTPDGYFDSLTDKIMDRVVEEASIKPTTKVIRLVKPLVAMAASFLLIFMLIYFPVKNMGPKFAQNSEQENELEIMDLYYFSDHEIASAIETKTEEETYNDEMMEIVLLASVSDMELYNLEN